MLPAQIAPIYVVLFPELKKAADECGYALGVHGSVGRDFDLIAVPWKETITDQETLIEAMRAACGGMILPMRRLKEGYMGKNPTVRFHGRVCWSIRLKGESYLDISVFSPSKC